ncbi:uncharacterized protein LOC128283946, partial [Gossypium arboreum]|uniref:uncharacterized protein LOC128283946 n=1 Tax=Gossypium arboreum TaxID=29729 RepID=UPI0022F15061
SFTVQDGAVEKWMRMRGKYGEYEVVFLFLRLEKIAVGRMLIFPKVKVILVWKICYMMNKDRIEFIQWLGNVNTCFVLVKKNCWGVH